MVFHKQILENAASGMDVVWALNRKVSIILKSSMYFICIRDEELYAISWSLESLVRIRCFCFSAAVLVRRFVDTWCKFLSSQNWLKQSREIYSSTEQNIHQINKWTIEKQNKHTTQVYICIYLILTMIDVKFTPLYTPWFIMIQLHNPFTCKAIVYTW